MATWNVIKDDQGKVQSHGYCDWQQKYLAAGWTIESYDKPQDSIIESMRADHASKENDRKTDKDSAKAKLKVLGLTDAELKAMGL